MAAGHLRMSRANGWQESRRAQDYFPFTLQSDENVIKSEFKTEKNVSWGW